MEKINKVFYFHRENNNFDDLLAENCIKKAQIKLFYDKHVIVSSMFNEPDIGYLTIKYGDEMINPIVDFKPEPGIDYIPKRL